MLTETCCLVFVPFDPVKSADPPSNCGTTGTKCSSVICDQTRVARLAVSARNAAFASATPCATAFGSISASAAFTSGGALSSFAFHLALAALPRSPVCRHAARIWSGMTNAGAVHPSFSRAPAISAAPSAPPCAPAVPAFVGAPNPITVLHAISHGLVVSARALASAFDTPSTSCPSTRMVFQPEACARANWSSETLNPVAPSIVMLLSSNSTTSLPSFRCPASEIASCEMPSIRQPSPAMQ